VRMQGIQEIHTEPRGLIFVEREAGQQVGFGQIEDFELHRLFWLARLMMRCLASSQSEKVAVPACTACSVSAKASRCHLGGGSLSSSLERSAQSASMARSLSARVIF